MNKKDGPIVTVKRSFGPPIRINYNSLYNLNVTLTKYLNLFYQNQFSHAAEITAFQPVIINTARDVVGIEI